MSELSPTNIARNLHTAYIGQNVVYYPTVESTQETATEHANAGAPKGTLIIADEQTAGRGRLDRQWFALRGSSLLFSLILRPQIPLSLIHQLTMLCSLAVADAVSELYPLHPSPKWPNDVYLEGKKLAGILTTASFTDAMPDYVIVGVGLNVNMDVSALPPLMAPATSLSDALGYSVPRLPLLQRILENIETRYNRLRAGESPHDEWAARLITINRPVRVTAPDGVVTGVAEEVDETGALLLRRDDGSHVRVVVGDVTLRE